eukprot:CAMPEP_0171600954 /NCGR_PEP_ID=MMETSP0990-20121206/4631_1 /TAXON_ID=483369 /ORGANISM="non described non described, Strain CCMP2098" /LENGTH=54 /DNA_ID=CAMNT_0012163011 /DNA_START=117 /DNA_END=277 /DNA_ORIENTATION=+
MAMSPTPVSQLRGTGLLLPAVKDDAIGGVFHHRRLRPLVSAAGSTAPAPELKSS